MSHLKTFKEYLPDRPYCTDELGSMRILPRENAAIKKYVQPNAPWDLRWLIYDVDRETATFDWEDKNAPAPNIIATNRDNGHAHLFYGLAFPVHMNHGSRRHPLRLAGTVDIGLTNKLEADPAYAKLLSKNPLREDHWIVREYQQSLYDLNWLLDFLDVDDYKDLRKHLPESGLGRNCTLFDNLREWAYKAIREPYFNFDMWLYAVESKAKHYNHFEIPLPYSEVKSISKSVARWVWKNMSADGFNHWAENRRQASIRTRQAKSQERADYVMMMKAEGWSDTYIAEQLGISRRHVYNLRKCYISNIKISENFVISDDSGF